MTEDNRQQRAAILKEMFNRRFNRIGLQPWPMYTKDGESQTPEARFFRIKIGWLFVYFDVENDKAFAFHVINQKHGQSVRMEDKFLVVLSQGKDSKVDGDTLQVIGDTVLILSCPLYGMEAEQFNHALDFVTSAATVKLTPDLFDELLAIVGNDNKASQI